MREFRQTRFEDITDRYKKSYHYKCTDFFSASNIVARQWNHGF